MHQTKGLYTKNEKAQINMEHKMANDIKAKIHKTAGYKIRTGCTWNLPKSNLDH